MSSDPNEAVPGPSNVQDPDITLTDSPSERRVMFDPDVEDQDDKESSPGPRRKRIDSQTRFRRQSVMGQSGFVTQLLEEYLEEDSGKDREDEHGRKPIRKQTLTERRASVKAVEADMSHYIKETTRKSRASISTSNMKIPTLTSQEKLEELQNLSKLIPDESLPSSGWKPAHVMQEERLNIQQERSWVGTYELGKDYWSPAEEDIPEEKEVSFSMDNRRKSWYEMPLHQSYVQDSAFPSSKHRSLSQIDVLKDKMDDEYKQKRKERVTAAAHAREEPKSLDIWSEEFKDYFREVSRSSKYSHYGTHISMVDADKWLERAGILNYNELTLLHTGFCFLACGGSRSRGLSFNEFTQYLQMIAFTTGLRLEDIIARMIACQRHPGRVL